MSASSPHPGSPARRGGWALPAVLLGLIAFGVLEIWLLTQLAQAIGIGWTVLILIAETLLGAALVKREGSRAWKALNASFASGKLPTGELADTALILVGGVLLVVPGLISDVIGLLFLLPFTRPLARKVLAFFVARRMVKLGLSTTYARRDGTVIEGETVDEPAAGTQPDTGSTASGPIIIAGEIEDGR